MWQGLELAAARALGSAVLPANGCWAHPHDEHCECRQWCGEAEVSDLGLCARHYAEIVGMDALVAKT